MIIVPKFGEKDFNVSDELIGVIEGKIELHMSTKDYKISLGNCIQVINNIKVRTPINEVVLHLPYSLHTFETITLSEKNMYGFKEFIRNVEYYSIEAGVKIGILLHQESSLELLESVDPGYTGIYELLNFIRHDSVYLLVENCLPYLNSAVPNVVQAFELLQNIKHDKLLSCLDVCHSRCHENVFNTKFIIPEDIKSRIKWIHFADTLNNDGYNDKSTHGVKHTSMQRVYNDLEFLVNNEIDLTDLPVVSEINETDYKLRPNMLAEIRMLKLVRSNFSYYQGREYFK